MANAAYEETKAALTDALEALDLLTDASFLLLHQISKGYRTEQQEEVVKWAVDDAIATLQKHGRTYDGCTQCGSAHPESSPWHATHCLRSTP